MRVVLCFNEKVRLKLILFVFNPYRLYPLIIYDDHQSDPIIDLA